MLANQLADDLQSSGIVASAVDQRDITLDTIAQTPKEDVWLFLNACFGKGEPTDSAQALLGSINTSEQARSVFEGRRVGLFGLGASRSHAAHYQVVVRELDTRLQELDAIMVHERGEGDDSGDLFDDFDTWQEGIVPELKKLKDSGAAGAKSAPEGAAAHDGSPAAATTTAASEEGLASLEEFDYFAASQRIGLGTHARVSRLERVSPPSSERPVFHLRLTPTGTTSGLDYRVGDHLNILPNTTRHALDLVNALGLSTPAAVSACTAVEYSSAVPKPAIRVLHEIAARAVARMRSGDAVVPPDRAARAIAQAAFLEACLESPGHFNAYTRADGALSLADAARHASDAVRGFCDERTDLPRLLASMPRLRQRSYSIASAPAAQGGAPDGSVDLLLRRVLFPKLASPHDEPSDTASLEAGTCSAWVSGSESSDTASLEAGTCSAWVSGSESSDAAAGLALECDVMCGVRSADFGIPSDATSPLFMIAGGVGLAPFLGFLQARRAVAEAAREAAGAEAAGADALGPAMVVRCAAVQSDLLLTEQLQEALDDGILSSVVDVVAALDGVVPAATPSDEGMNGRIVTSACRTIDEALAKDVRVTSFVKDCLSVEGTGQGFVCGGASGFGAAVAGGLASALKEEWTIPEGAAAHSTGSCRAWTVVDSIIEQDRWHEDLAD